MLVCGGAQRALEPQDLIPPIRISVGKQDKYGLQLKWSVEDIHTHSQAHTYTHFIRKPSAHALHQLPHPHLFFCDFFLFQVCHVLISSDQR